VSVSGVLQDPSTYSVSGTTLTFSGAPPSGTSNISVRFLGIPASGVTTTAYRTVTEFTATSGQTTFSVPSYTVGYIDVYRNGVLLGSADYTATNGTTVVLVNGCTAGDLVETISFFVSSVLNAIPAVANAVTTSYINDGAVTTAKIAAGAVIQADLATGVAGTGPAFAAWQSTAQTALGPTTFTKLLFQTEEFDTNNNFASSTFTPTVAGYYQINGSMQINGTTNGALVAIYKNGSLYKTGMFISPSASATLGSPLAIISSLVFLNGSTDYVELYGFTVASLPPIATISNTYFNGSMVRAA
jgi:hypothetical protein